MRVIILSIFLFLMLKRILYSESKKFQLYKLKKIELNMKAYTYIRRNKAFSFYLRQEAILKLFRIAKTSNRTSLLYSCLETGKCRQTNTILKISNLSFKAFMKLGLLLGYYNNS